MSSPWTKNKPHRYCKARYTLAIKLKSTRSTLLKVDKVDRVTLAPYPLATKSKGRSTFGRQSRLYRRQSRPSWRQCRPRQAVEFKLLPICGQNWRQSRPYRRQSTLSPICRQFRQQSSSSPVCTGL